MDIKIRPICMLSTRDPLQIRDAKSLKGRGWKKVFHANGIQKKVGVAIFLSKNMSLKQRLLQESKKDTTK